MGSQSSGEDGAECGTILEENFLTAAKQPQTTSAKMEWLKSCAIKSKPEHKSNQESVVRPENLCLLTLSI